MAITLTGEFDFQHGLSYSSHICSKRHRSLDRGMGETVGRSDRWSDHSSLNAPTMVTGRNNDTTLVLQSRCCIPPIIHSRSVLSNVAKIAKSMEIGLSHFR